MKWTRSDWKFFGRIENFERIICLRMSREQWSRVDEINNNSNFGLEER